MVCGGWGVACVECDSTEGRSTAEPIFNFETPLWVMIKRCVAKSSTYVRAEVAAHGSTRRRWLDMRWVVGVHSRAAGDSLESNSCPQIRNFNRQTACSSMHSISATSFLAGIHDDRELILQAWERNTAFSSGLDKAGK